MAHVEVHQAQLHFDLNPESQAQAIEIRTVGTRPDSTVNSQPKPEVTVDTGEQDTAIDRLVDQGFTYAAAKSMVLGTLATNQNEVEVAIQHEQPKIIEPRRGRKVQPIGKNDRRRLSSRGKMIADEPPAHIKRY